MLWRYLICFAAVLGVGTLRFPYELCLSKDLKERRLIAPSFDAEARAGLSQKAWVAGFGSLRPALASFYSLGAIRFHASSNWRMLEERIEQVLLLDPYNPYYWNDGAWHLAYNAAADVLEDESLAPLERKGQFKEWILKGDALYQRGIEVNPEDLKLRLERARLWSSPLRILDYPKVVEILESCLVDLELPDARVRRIKLDQFYSLLRIPGREQAAYELGRSLFDADPKRASSSLMNGLCALQLHPEVEVINPLSLNEIYGDRQFAKKLLRHYLEDLDPDKPRYGMAELLDSL